MPTRACPQAAESLLLGRYRQIEATTRQMLAAAREADWSGVRRCESAIGDMSRQLELAKTGARLSPLEDRERMSIMRRLVQADAEVRRLAEPWSGCFDAMFAARTKPAPARVRPA
jgi:flagellar protein FliT